MNLENLNKETAIVAGVAGVTSLVIGLFAGKYWGKRSANAAQAAAVIAATTATTEKPAADQAA